MQENPSSSDTAEQHMRMPLWYYQMSHASASLTCKATKSYLSQKTTRYTVGFTCRQVPMPLTILVGRNILQVVQWPGLTLGFHTAEDPALPYQKDSLTFRRWGPQGNLCPAEAIQFCVIFPGTLTGEPGSSSDSRPRPIEGDLKPSTTNTF